MARLSILEFPDSRLRKIASPITDVTGKIATLADDMLETMYAAPGIGLAASQVNVHQRLIVVDISNEKNEPVILINPKIIATEGERRQKKGFCLFQAFMSRSRGLTVLRLQPSTEMVSPIHWWRKDCWLFAFSMRWTIWKDGSSSTIFPTQNVK